VTIGDMATTRVDGTFTVAYLVFNTINNLTSQEAQVACGAPLQPPDSCPSGGAAGAAGEAANGA